MTKKIKDCFVGLDSLKYERRFSLAYKFLLLFYLTAQTIAPLHRTFVISIFLWAMLTVATVNFIFRLTNINRFCKTPYFFILFAFLCSEAISIVVNFKYGVSQNISHFIIFAFIIFLIYANDINRKSNDVWDDLVKLGKTHIAIMDTSVIASFVMLFLNYGKTIEIEDYKIKIGFVENRLWGVFRDPNHAAIFMIIAILFSIYAIYYAKNKRAKAYYIISDILMMIYIAFSDSRTARYALLGSSMFLVYVICWKFFFKKIKLEVLRQIFIVAIALIVGIVTYKAPDFITDTYNKAVISYESYHSSQVEGEPDGDEGESTSLVVYRTYDLSKDPLNKRSEIWKNGFELIKEKPIFGTTFFNIKSFLRTEMPSSYIIQPEHTFSHFHNEIINVFASQGFVGLFLLGAFAVLMLISIIRYYFKMHGKRYLQMSISLTILLAMCCEMLVQQGPLYNYTPSMFFFWALLGFIAHTINETKNEMLQQKSEKFAFAVDTPLQMLNSVNFVLNDTKGSKNNSDIYIYHQFRGSNELSRQLKESGIFNNVYDIDVYKKYPSLINKIATIYRLLFPTNAIKAAARGKVPMNKKSYSYMCASFPTSFTTGMHMAYPKADVLLIEDGTGSYFGNIVDDYSTGIFKFIDKFFFANEMSIQPKEIYLSNPQLSKNNIDSKICKLEKISDENIDKIEKIFAYKENNLYTENRVVYLTQPLDEKEGFVKDNEIKIESMIENIFASSAVARIHPRHANAKFERMCVDTYANLWELECIKQISDRNILIGAFSTAQFMPKILKNAEPTIVFTYKLLFKNPDDEFWQETGSFIESFKSLYSDQNKIFVPETVGEFEELLKKINVAQ